jgi:2-pyrone-4,6-dicarboxylate lactonase
VFPYAPERRYTPCDAPKERLWALRDHLGFERNVIVQATCHGTDNRAMVDAVSTSGGRARGVAVVSEEVTAAELREFDRAGVRGLRFNFVRRLGYPLPRPVIRELAARIADLGWHAILYFDAADLPDLCEFITSLPAPVVIDHMGRPDFSQPVDGHAFAKFLRLLASRPDAWCKVSGAERLSRNGPPGFDDYVPFARRVVETFPDRVLWGTEWPHPNLKTHMPDDGRMVDLIPRIAVTPELQRKLLVDNPMRLYWSH